MFFLAYGLANGTVVVQGRLISQPAKGVDLRSCLDRVHWDLTGAHGWLLGWCPPALWSGRVRWVASLGFGGALERLLRGWWVRQGFPVDTECIADRDYSFPVGLGNPAWALLCRVWLWDLAGWFGCAAHAACLLNRLGSLPGDLLVSPTVLSWSGRCDLTGSVVK